MTKLYLQDIEVFLTLVELLELEIINLIVWN